MHPFVLPIITSAVSALVGAIVSGLLTKARTVSGRQSAIEDGMKTLLKAELYNLHHRYVEEDEPMDAMGLQLASSTYAVYHDQLGGNGLGTRLYDEISNKGIKN